MKTALTSIVFAAALAAAQATHAYVVVFEDGFDAEPGGSALNHAAFANWNVLNGSVDKIVSGDFGIICAGGTGQCLDMDGSTSNAGDLVTKAAFDIQAGDSVRLSFAFSGNQRGRRADSMTVSLGSLFSETFAAVPANQPFETIVRTFVASESALANLAFSHAGGDNFGIILDSVKLEMAPVPLPGAALLLGSVLVPLASRSRRASRAA